MAEFLALTFNLISFMYNIWFLDKWWKTRPWTIPIVFIEVAVNVWMATLVYKFGIY